MTTSRRSALRRLAWLVAATATGVALWSQVDTVVHAATCTGANPCNACKNCSSCAHCAKRGGTCGICRRKDR